MMAPGWTVVIVEDDEKTAAGLVKMAAKADLESAHAENLEEAIVAIDRLAKVGRLAGVIADLKLPGTSRNTEYGGWDAVSHASSVNPGCPIAIYSSHFGPFEAIVKATASVPAFAPFIKPADDQKLEKWLLNLGQSCRGAKSAIMFDPQVVDIYRKLAPIYGPSDLPVLIVGESGTGKETLAREIHATSNVRGPFVAVNCAALDEGVVLAELFGSERGSWTDSHSHKLGLILYASGYVGDPEQAEAVGSFVDWLRGSAEGQLLKPDESQGDLDLYSLRDAKAVRGTLFLDEVTLLPPKAMGGLLRALSTQDVRPYGLFGPGFRVHCRIIAATNDLSALRSDDRDAAFRHDLFYRLGGVVLSLPSVRSPEVIAAFAKSPYVWTSMGLPPLGFASGALQPIFNLYSGAGEVELAYQRGNFRTLRHLLHRAGLIAAQDGGREIRKEHVEAAIQHGVVPAASPVPQPSAAEAQPDPNAAPLRQEFLAGLQAHGESLDTWFGLADLQRVTAKSPLLVGDAFLRCCLANRTSSDGGSPYSFQEIEEALTSGASRNAWLNKGLTKDAVRAAAIQFYHIPRESQPAAQASINAVVSLLRSLGGKRKLATAPGG
jgi:two-component system C4-dicarboxylate transport response regulator DctD